MTAISAGGGGYNSRAPRQRLPTLFEVLNRRTQPPVDLWSFYVFMREQYHGVDYLDFWLDVIQHLSLCRHYIRGLRQSILAQSEIDNASSHNSSVLLDTLIQEGGLNDTDSHRLSAFLRGEDASAGNQETLFRLSALLDAMNARELDIADLHAPPTRGENFISRVNQNNAEKSNEELARALSDPNNDGSEDSQYDEKQDRTVVAPRVSSGFTGAKAATATAGMAPSIASQSAAFGGDEKSQYSSMRSSSGSPNAPLMTNKRNSQATRSSSSRARGAASMASRGSAAGGRGGIPPNVALNAETIERLFPRRESEHEDSGSFVGRQDIRQSSHRILVTYFIPGAERELALPSHIMKSVKQAIEVDGRDDPEVFDEAREYVFQAMEREAFPNFLAARALGNIVPLGSLIRMIVGLVSLFAAFWVGFILIFLDWKPKATRCWLILPFGVGAYGIFSSLYNLDPIMAIAGYSEAVSKRLIRIREPYVRQLLVKRSLYVLSVIILVAAVFVIIFALVPGDRL